MTELLIIIWAMGLFIGPMLFIGMVLIMVLAYAGPKEKQDG
jgi:hypothetical protein